MGPKVVAQATRRIASAMKTVEPLRPAAQALQAYAAQEEKIGEMLDLFAPFTTVQKGPFSCANTRAAYARLSVADRARLPWEPEKLDWPDYWMTAHMPAIERRVIPEIEKRTKKELVPLASHETLVTLLEQMAGRHDVAVALSHLEDTGLTRVSYRICARRRRGSARASCVTACPPGTASSSSRTTTPIGRRRTSGCSSPAPRSFRWIRRAADAFARILVESGARAVVWDERVKERLAEACRKWQRSTSTRRRSKAMWKRRARGVARVRGARRRREPHLHERHDGRPQGRDAHARELHVARRRARAHLPARRRAIACCRSCRCTTPSSSRAACSCRCRAARASSTSTSSRGDRLAKGLELAA